jgi:hypothetical protein
LKPPLAELPFMLAEDPDPEIEVGAGGGGTDRPRIGSPVPVTGCTLLATELIDRLLGFVREVELKLDVVIPLLLEPEVPSEDCVPPLDRPELPPLRGAGRLPPDRGEPLLFDIPDAPLLDVGTALLERPDVPLLDVGVRLLLLEMGVPAPIPE